MKNNITRTTYHEGAGELWQQLREEREVICDALLKDYPPRTENCEKLSASESQKTASWHLHLLQDRLAKVDNALDRLMAGSWGSCCSCGKWIEDTKLHLDPAIAYCFECWSRQQNNH